MTDQASSDPALALRREGLWNWRTILFWVAIIVGGLLRFYALDRVPAGLNGDEASDGVDVLALLQFGADRWGNHLPIWLPGPGTGNNPLYAYLTVPVFALFGANVLTLRLVGAIFGLATIPLSYFAAKVHFNRDTALATMLLVAFLPWHIMGSRWAIDSNLAIFFFTLGLLTLGKALAADAGPVWKVAAFLPWAICAYSYPLSFFPAVGAGAVIVIFHWRTVLASYRLWALGLLLALLIDLPFALFLLKNYVGVAIPFESGLPFSIPALATSRFDQVHEPLAQLISKNLTFLLNSYRDGLVWNDSDHFLPLTGAATYLTLLGILSLATAGLRAKQPNLVLIVVLTSAIPIVLLPLHVTRLNWFFIPSLMVIADLFFGGHRLTISGIGRTLMLWVSAVYVALCCLLFYGYYFTRYNDEILSQDVNLGNGFRVGLESALHAAANGAKPGEQIFVDIGTPYPYDWVIFYGLSDIRQFQATRQMTVENGVFHVSSFDRFVFDSKALLPSAPSFVFVSRAAYPACPAPHILKTGPVWMTGRCDRG